MSSKLERVIHIDRFIRQGHYPSITWLQGQFEVSERTIHNDLTFLRERLNAPLRYSRSRGGYFYADATWVLPAMLTTEGELLAFFLSAELSRRYLGTRFEAPLRKAIDQFTHGLPDHVTLDLSHLAQHYTFQPGATVTVDPALLTDLHTAIRAQYQVQMTYFTKSRGEETERIIEPHHLFQVRGDWQVIGYDHLRQQFRNFAVDSIRAWQVLHTQPFTRDPTFDPGHYLAQGFLSEHGSTPHAVTIIFDQYQARYMVNRQWHPTQTTELHADGSLTLRFTTGALAEVKRWVLGFGQHARVEEPPELRAAVEQEIQAMAAMYHTSA